MSHPVTKERIDKFWQDRRLLPYDDVIVAARMQKDKSNYSKSVKEGPITNGFLRKFYDVFGEELKELMQDHKHNDTFPTSILYEGWAEIIPKMTNTLHKLTEANHILVQNNQQLIEAHISMLDHFLKKSGKKT